MNGLDAWTFIKLTPNTFLLSAGRKFPAGHRIDCISISVSVVKSLRAIDK